MNDQRPDFDELVGSDVDALERDRLRRVHDALVAAGPPPELVGRLTTPPAVGDRVVPLAARRRRVLLVGLAAALALAVFAGGVAVGDRRATPTPVEVVSMTGTPLASNASASLDLFAVDSAGNWPMRLSVSGLAPSANGRPYELWLTRHGKVVALCGSFVPRSDGTTVVPMNAPYRLTEYDGWVIVREGSQTPLVTT
jgi:hypothetical protein